MPRKTKKEKIIAEYRRKLKKWKFGEISKAPEEKKGKEISPQEVKSAPAKTSSPASSSPKTTLIKQDLKKTLILSTLAISLEIMLYWLIELP